MCFVFIMQSPSLLYRDTLSGDKSMVKASCSRASRMARPCDPTQIATDHAHRIVIDRFRKIRDKGIEKAPRDTHAFRVQRHYNGPVNGHGSRSRDSGKMNHIASIKAKDVDTNNTEPAFLLGGHTAPMKYDRLAENCLRANALNSSVMGRKKTQGAANQTTRIQTKSIGQAASAQIVSSSLAIAEFRYRLMQMPMLHIVVGRTSQSKGRRARG